jgi:hypothetical protein
LKASSEEENSIACAEASEGELRVIYIRRKINTERNKLKIHLRTFPNFCSDILLNDQDEHLGFNIFRARIGKLSPFDYIQTSERN